MEGIKRVFRGNAFQKVVRMVAPPPQQSDDGRDQWPSRAAFLLAAMGGCAGMGNLLRYPSQMFNNPGLQWFIPYLMTVFLIAIPVLVLEISIGQAYRGGCVVAYNAVDHRLKGLGLSLLYVGLVVSPYFVVNLAWIMSYFRHSFRSPLPWKEDGEYFYNYVVVANKDPIDGSYSDDGSSVASYVQYPGVALIGETVGWTAFTWFLIYISIFRGVGLTGRVVYFTMGLPIVITIILIGRSLSLENAGEGVKTFWGSWNSSQLASGTIWQTACGQVFFSTGVGFGYFTSYASYNQKHSNAIMDSILIVSSNVLFENIAAFAVFGVVGFLRLFPEDGVRLGGFTVGFLTLPSAVAQMPAANFWAIILFFTLMVLGYSSAFAMVDAIVTLIMDAQKKYSRPLIVSIVVVICFLLSLPYCTEFGYYLLTGIDRWTSDVALVFVVFSECVCSTTLYRWRDVVAQVGKKAMIVHNVGFVGSMIIGLVVAHTVQPGVGAGVGFAVYFLMFGASVMMSLVPHVQAPGFMGKNVMTNRIYYLAFYSGNQLRHDLNQIVGQGKNWSLPVFWAPMIRYIAAPILAIVFSFSYPGFYELRNDPLHIMGFGVAHIALILIFAGFMLPRWFNVMIPPQRRGEGKLDIGAGVLAETWMDQEQQDVAEQASAPVSKEESGNVSPPSKEEMPGNVSLPTKETRSSSSDTMNRTL
jgi:solute carrier family 6 GABA transporter-like protein 1